MKSVFVLSLKYFKQQVGTPLIAIKLTFEKFNKTNIAMSQITYCGKQKD